MTHRFSRGLLAVAGWLGVAAVVAGAGRSPAPSARQFLQKLAAIEQNGGRQPVKPLRVTLLEDEINAFLVDGEANLPPGIMKPHVTLAGPGQVSGTAIVDLDALRKQRAQASAFSPLAYLSGKLPVSVSGILKSAGGRAQFELQSAQVNGVPVPKMLIDELVSYYARSAALPSGISLDSPFPLPDRIKQIDVQRGQAIIIQ